MTIPCPDYWEETMLGFLYRVSCRPFKYEYWLWRGLGGPPIFHTPANAITMWRAKAILYLAPVLYGVYEATHASFFAIALITLIVVCGALDGVDGWVAKRRNCITNAGRYLDPAADAINVIYGFRVLAGEYNFDRWLMVPLVGIVAFGVIIFFCIRLQDEKIRTHMLARFTILAMYVGGVVLFVGIAARLYEEGTVYWWATLLGYGLLWIAFAMMIASAVQYRRLQRQKN